MENTDIDEAWTILGRHSTEVENMSLVKLDVVTSNGNLYLGKTHDNIKYLLIPIGDISDVPSDQKWRSISLRQVQVSISGIDLKFLELSCEDLTLMDIFFELVKSVVSAITSKPNQAVGVCRKVLSRWRELLAGLPTLFTEEAAIGLFGELYYLLKIAKINPQAAVRCWVGPTGARHDFDFGQISLEVKSTKQIEGRFVEINGVLQLLPQSECELFLGFLHLEQKNDGDSISDLINSAIELGADREAIFHLAGMTGWTAESDSHRFRKLGEKIYCVDNKFPRIVPESFVERNLPEGVLRLKYQLDLSGPTPLALDQQENNIIIARMANAQ